MEQYLLPITMRRLTAPLFLMEYLKGGNLTTFVSLTMLSHTSIVTIALSSMNEEDEKVIEPGWSQARNQIKLLSHNLLTRLYHHISSRKKISSSSTLSFIVTLAISFSKEILTQKVLFADCNLDKSFLERWGVPLHVYQTVHNADSLQLSVPSKFASVAKSCLPQGHPLPPESPHLGTE